MLAYYILSFTYETTAGETPSPYCTFWKNSVTTDFRTSNVIYYENEYLRSL